MIPAVNLDKRSLQDRQIPPQPVDRLLVLVPLVHGTVSICRL